MGFDIAGFLIFVVMAVERLAFLGVHHGIDVDPIQIVFVPQDPVAVFVQDWIAGNFIMLKQ